MRRVTLSITLAVLTLILALPSRLDGGGADHVRFVRYPGAHTHHQVAVHGGVTITQAG
jgi:hypothetical protein